jgi:hypothetical protein
VKSETEFFLKDIMQKYFKRMSVLVSQIPAEVRTLLLPPYTLYTGFTGILYVDKTGRLGFEILRQRASRLSVKVRNTSLRVEQEIFGALGKLTMFRIDGHNTEIHRGVFTCKDFTEKYEHELPKGQSVLNFYSCEDASPIELGTEAECKIVDCGIFWIIKNRRHVKRIHFAWLFGNTATLTRIDPLCHSESDFYSFLFGKLYQIITHGYEKPVDDKTQERVLEVYAKLIERVESEFKEHLVLTKGDEYVFQQLLTKHKFFLYPAAQTIESQPTLLKMVTRRPDFHVQVKQNEHIYVEIEPPFYKPFEGSKQTQRLREALEQVEEWKKILSTQSDAGQTIRYLIIIGLLDDLNTDERQAIEEFNKAQQDLAVVTWNSILQNINEMKRQMTIRLGK